MPERGIGIFFLFTSMPTLFLYYHSSVSFPLRVSLSFDLYLLWQFSSTSKIFSLLSLEVQYLTHFLYLGTLVYVPDPLKHLYLILFQPTKICLRHAHMDDYTFHLTIISNCSTFMSTNSKISLISFSFY